MRYLSKLTVVVAPRDPERQALLFKELEAVWVDCKEMLFPLLDAEEQPMHAMLVLVVWCAREAVRRKW